MKNKIDVSFVMTVYNKEYYLPSVLKALLNQTGLQNPEFIFIDDLSKDKSVEIIKKYTKDIPNVTIIENKDNQGISPRTNQGLALAKGEYVRFLDSDDILPLNSTEKMLELARELNADMVYGCFTKTGLEPHKLEKEYLETFDYEYNPDALEAVLTGRFTRMGQLLKTDVVKKGKGADERVFIQDESLPLRCAIYAHGAIKMNTNVVLVPKEIGNFSGNKIQLDNDRFLAYCYAIEDNPKLAPKYKKLMYGRAVSAYWKYVKKTSFCPYITQAFAKYITNKICPSLPDMVYLGKMKKCFLSLPNIRRIKK